MPKFSAQDREKIYKRLLVIGEQQFNENGFYEVTAAKVALAAGIAKGTFYHFFENKEHLYMVINHQIQDEIFANVDKRLMELTNTTQQECFYEILCYIAEEFLKHPVLLEVDAGVWGRIEEKAPRECIVENAEQDMKLVRWMEKAGYRFRYGIAPVTRLLQMQFMQLAYIRKSPDDLALLKIALRALAEYLIKENE